MRHRLLLRQMRKAALGKPEGGAEGGTGVGIDLERLLDLVSAAYDDLDRDRERQERSSRLMAEELEALNQRILKDADARLQTVIGSMHDAFALYDRGDALVVWNQRYEDMFPSLKAILRPGVSFREVVEGVVAAEAVDPRFPSAKAFVDWRLDQHRRAGARFERHLTDGRIFEVDERRTADGSTLFIGRDVTEIKRVEGALRAALADAEAADRAKGEFLAAMSHEIRTPMNGVIAMNELLLDSDLTAQQRSLALVVQRSGTALLQIIDDILDVSKLEAGRVELERIPFALAQVIEDVVQLLGPKASAKGLSIAVLPMPSPSQLFVGDPTRLRQVLINLIGNAIKFTEHGHVDVMIRTEAADEASRTRALSIAVRDSGIGMSADTRERLFNKFVQGDSSITRRYGGSGLGLAISRMLVDLMGGTIEVESREGLGSTFTVHLKLPVPCSEDLETLAEATRADGRTAGAAVPRARLLVAEDNEVNRTVIGALLDRLGHDVAIVPNGLEALRALGEGSYDLVLMDLHMPSMSGEEAVRAIRALPGPVSRIPVCALTADAMHGTRERLLAAGFDDYVTKPLDRERLSAAIGRLLPATAAASAVGDGGIDGRAVAELREVLAPDQVDELVGRFMEGMREGVADLAVAVATGNYAAAHRQAHSLKSNAAQFGLMRLAGALEAAERACVEGRHGDLATALSTIRDRASPDLAALERLMRGGV